MPFLGQDWRSPGWSWTKTEEGWKRLVLFGHELGDSVRDLEELCNENKENVFGDVCELTTKKRKKDFYNNNTKSQCGKKPRGAGACIVDDGTVHAYVGLVWKVKVLHQSAVSQIVRRGGGDTGSECGAGDIVFRDKWIYVQKGSTRERHGYCTLGEAFNRLDFSSAIEDMRRFNYVVKLFQLIAKSQLTSLSGAAQKNYFNILEKIVRKVLDDHYNPRLIKGLLQDLSSTLYSLTVAVGRSVLVGNVNIWMCRLETILSWQQQLNNLQIPKQMSDGVTFSDLPLQMQNKILYKFSDANDIINLGQATHTLHILSEDRKLWKTLCQFHFSEKQFCRNLVLTESNNVDWKLMYFTLQKHYPKREHYGDTLHFCKHCSILFWKDRHLALLFKECSHPCTATDPDDCLVPVSPQHFIDLFRF